jgi:excisionase family DNA binding protein
LAQRRARRRLKPRHLTSGELANLTGISKRSIVKAVSEGRIKASRTVGGHYRISLAEARRFMSDRGLDTSALDIRENCALVVALDRFVGDLLADVLGRAGVEVMQTDCPFEAGVMAATHHPWLLIVDAAAAVPSPVSMCRCIIASDCCRQARILVLTGSDSDEKERLLAAGAHGVLGKPFSVKQLKNMLRDLGFATGNFRRVES